MLFHKGEITKKIKLNVYTNVKILNRKELQLKILFSSEYTYTDINKQLVKEE